MSHGCLWDRLEAHPSSNLWRLFGKTWDPAERYTLLKRREQRVRLCVMMYKYQMQHGRYSVHEHQDAVSS